jgi:MFS family permease
MPEFGVQLPGTGSSVVRNRTVLGIGLASFFSDSGHEMATAALPAFLRSLGAPAAALGLIEGFADGALSLSKLAGGVMADRPGGGRRRLAAAGYLTTGVAYGSFALAGSWPFVAIARAAAWSARGARTPARDALLASAVPPTHLGRAFGVERAGDSAGAIVGPLVAAVLIGLVGFRWLFGISVLPAIGAALSILLLVREVPKLGPEIRERVRGIMRRLAFSSGPFRTLIAGTGLYGLGNFSATLLILYATNVLAGQGRSTADAASIAVLLYAAHNAANAAAAYPAGALADRIGRRSVLVGGILLFAAACFGFAAGPSGIGVLAVLFVAVGASTGMVETAQGSHASELLAEEVRGRGFGVLGLVDGVGDLVSSVVVGVLFTYATPLWGFLYGGALSVAGATVLLPGLRGTSSG